jgi:phosphate transport system substrate-binding protein
MIRFGRFPIASVGLTLIGLLAGCNSSGKQAAENNSHIIIIGAGSTFINPIMSHWIADFQASHPAVQINYQSIGSGGGIEQLKQGLVDFGASDAALDDQQLQAMPALLQIPESAGPVCITYNLPELRTPLKLSSATLAGIYLGRIQSWQDAAIRNDNAGVNLPNHAMVVAHRSDGSGTTNIFTMYLAKVSPDWASKVGKGIAVSWPVGLGGKGSEGVTGVVKQTPGAIGYVELSYAKANNLPVALVRNAAGYWTEPSVGAATAAIEAFQAELARDVRTSIVDPPASAKQAYPITGLTFLLVPKQAKDDARAQIVKQFAEYILTRGQDSAEGLEYARLPQSLVEQDQKLLAELPSGGAQTSSYQPSR